MKKLHPLPKGTGWLRTAFSALRDRLFHALLNRFIPGFDPFRLPFVVPMRSASLESDPHLLFASPDDSPPLPLRHNAHEQSHDSGGGSSSSCAACQRCATQDDVALAGESLERLPSWRYN